MEATFDAKRYPLRWIAGIAQDIATQKWKVVFRCNWPSLPITTSEAIILSARMEHCTFCVLFPSVGNGKTTVCNDLLKIPKLHPVSRTESPV